MRLNEQRFLILAALAGGPMHGYAIADEIRTLSDGHHTPRPGSLYHAIDKLVESDLAEIDREETVDGRLRRYYRLTEAGTASLTTEANRRAAAGKQQYDDSAQTSVVHSHEQRALAEATRRADQRLRRQ